MNDVANTTSANAGLRCVQRMVRRFGRGDPEIEAKRLANLREANAKPRTPEHIAHLKASLKKKWASGTRKPTPPEAYQKSAQSIKHGWEAGTRKPRDPDEWKRTCAKGLANRKYENIVIANQILGRQREGHEMAQVTTRGKPSRGAKGVNNWKAKWWGIERHDGVVIEGKNLNELIRQNAHLFAPEDVVWKKASCRASKGIRGLFEGRVNGPKVWKGWSARDLADTPNMK